MSYIELKKFGNKIREKYIEEKLQDILKNTDFSEEEVHNINLLLDNDEEKIDKLLKFIEKNQTRNDIYYYVMKLAGIDNQKIVIEAN